jgi:signal transduction histidine kinase
MKIIKSCEKIFDFEIKELLVFFEKNQEYLIRYSKGEGIYSTQFNMEYLKCHLSYNKDVPLSDKEIDILKNLFDSFFEFSEVKSFSERWNCSSMLSSLLHNKSLDFTIKEMVKNLIESEYFDKVGIFFLNETLMKLKGVIFCEKNINLDYNQLAFKNVNIPLKNKNSLTDIIFFEKTDIISVESLNNEQLNKFFQGKILATGIYSSKGPIGLICGQREYYTKLNYKYLDLYAQICSVAIELSKTIKQLNFAINDVKFYKESMYASDSLAKIGKLSATIAHELKNPLVAIGGFSNRLKKFVSDDKGIYYLNIIISEIKRLENIVEEILNYSKNLNVVKKNTLAKKIITDAWTIVSEQTHTNCIYLVNELDDNMQIYVDEERIKQVLINIFDNAIHAINLRGTIKIEAISSEKSDIIYIKDTGGGIPEDILSKIFEPFFTTKEKGTGLGLALSKKILMAHGGDLNIFNGTSGAVAALLIPKVDN